MKKLGIFGAALLVAGCGGRRLTADAGSDVGAESPPPTADAAPEVVTHPQYLGTVSFLSEITQQTAVAIGPDGAVYLGGTFVQPTDFDPGPGVDRRVPLGNYDAFVTKLNADGSYAWTLTFGGKAPDPIIASLAGIDAIVVTSSEIVVAGNYDGTTIDLDPGAGVVLGDVGSAESRAGGFVSRFGLDGKLVWVSAFVGNNLLRTRALAVDAGGAIYAGGWFAGTTDFAPGPVAEDLRQSPGGEHGFLVKLSGDDGHELWAKTFEGDACTGTVEGVAVAPGDDVWTTGAFGIGCLFGGVPLSGPAVEGALVASFTPAGETRRGSTVIAGAKGNAIVIAPDGELFVGGEATGSVDFAPGPEIQLRDLPADVHAPTGFLLNLGVDGAFSHVDTFANLSVRALAPLDDGGVVLIAVPPRDLSPPSGSLVARRDGTGRTAWAFLLGDPDVVIHAVAAGSSTFAISGAMFDSDDLDPGPGVDIVPMGALFWSRYAF